MENSLIPTQEEMTTIQTMAKTAADSKYFDKIGGIAGLQAILFYARELGLPLMTCLFGGIRPVQGKMEVAPQMMNAMIRKAGHSLKTTIHTLDQCTIQGKRRDTGEEMTVTYTIEDAKRAKIYKNAWETYPKNMLYKSALANLARWLFPDVIGMAYMEDEIQDENHFKSKEQTKETIDIDPPKPKPEKKNPDTEKVDSNMISHLFDLIGEDDNVRSRLLKHCKIDGLVDMTVSQYLENLPYLQKIADERDAKVKVEVVE